MNRGVLVIGIVATFFTILNVFASVIGLAFLCFDSCPPVASNLSYAPWSIVIYVIFLAPALMLIMVAWIWELITLHDLRATGTLIVAAALPIIAIAAVIGISALAASKAGIAPLQFTPIQLWEGYFALTLWPLLVSVIAFIYRQRIPPHPAIPTAPSPRPTNTAEG